MSKQYSTATEATPLRMNVAVPSLDDVRAYVRMHLIAMIGAYAGENKERARSQILNIPAAITQLEPWKEELSALFDEVWEEVKG